MWCTTLHYNITLHVVASHVCVCMTTHACNVWHHDLSWWGQSTSLVTGKGPCTHSFQCFWYQAINGDLLMMRIVELSILYTSCEGQSCIGQKILYNGDWGWFHIYGPESKSRCPPYLSLHRYNNAGVYNVIKIFTHVKFKKKTATLWILGACIILSGHL